MIDIDDPATLEALFLRLEARRIVRARWCAGEPPPEGATAILGKYTPRQAGCGQRSVQTVVRKVRAGVHGV